MNMIVEIIFNFFKRLMVSMIKALNLQNNKVLRKSFSDRCVLTKNLNSNPLKTDETNGSIRNSVFKVFDKK